MSEFTWRNYEGAFAWNDLMDIERHNVIVGLNERAERVALPNLDQLRISQSSTLDEVMALANALDTESRERWHKWDKETYGIDP